MAMAIMILSNEGGRDVATIVAAMGKRWEDIFTGKAV